MILTIKHSEKRQNYGDATKISGCQGLREREMNKQSTEDF